MSPEGVTAGEWAIPESDLEERFETTGGPGGQHANRSETEVRLRLDIETSSLPDEVKAKLTSRIGPVIEVVAGESRSQWRNRALARQRMGEAIEAALVDPLPRKTTKPTRASKQKRLESKKARGKLKKLRRPPEID